jgi:D-2-hydroxyacid dehydrogenase (NADP+)
MQNHRSPDSLTGKPAPIRLLLGHGGTLQEKCRAISARIEPLVSADLERQPELLAEIEVIYGGFSPERVGEYRALRWVQTAGAGVDRFLTPAVRESRLIITNVSGIHAAPITEHMFGMLLAHRRRLCAAFERQRAAKWDSRGLGDDLPLLEGATLGLLGVGEIGTASARAGRGFGMDVIGFRRTGQAHPDLRRVFGPGELMEFLAESDVVMNTLPLTPETRGLLSTREFAAMRPGSVLINTGRGATIDTDALTAGLRSGRPGAALLDVTDPEPLPSDHPLWTMANVFITPHYSGAHSGYDTRANRIFLENLSRYVDGRPLTHVVDKTAGY